MASPSKLAGPAYALAGILVWGLSPLYWKALSGVPVFETLCHRVVWSAVFLAAWLHWRGRWKDVRATLAHAPTTLTLLATTLLIGFNWYLYIWAIQQGRVLETSLGYFMNPLVNVFLGVAFLKERLRPAQGAAMVLAAVAVVNLVASNGTFPWVAVSLATTFGAYALLRKISRAEALTGLAVETFLLALPAAAVLLWHAWKGQSYFLTVSRGVDLLLLGTVAVTALPLLWYTEGARRLNLKTLGVLQYLSPTIQFFLGVLVFKEPLSRARLLSFALVWAAVGLYAADSFAGYRQARAEAISA